MFDEKRELDAYRVEMSTLLGLELFGPGVEPLSYLIRGGEARLKAAGLEPDWFFPAIVKRNLISCSKLFMGIDFGIFGTILLDDERVEGGDAFVFDASNNLNLLTPNSRIVRDWSTVDIESIPWLTLAEAFEIFETVLRLNWEHGVHRSIECTIARGEIPRPAHTQLLNVEASIAFNEDLFETPYIDDKTESHLLRDQWVTVQYAAAGKPRIIFSVEYAFERFDAQQRARSVAVTIRGDEFNLIDDSYCLLMSSPRDVVTSFWSLFVRV